MKKITLALSVFLMAVTLSPRVCAQAINVNDSLALVDLYNNTGGPNWVNHTNWLTSNPVYTWFGITLNSDSTRVGTVALPNNNLVGTLPPSIGNWTSPFFFLDLNYNLLTGSLPASMANFVDASVVLAHNQFSGTPPDYHTGSILYMVADFNRFTFAGLEPFYLPDPQDLSYHLGTAFFKTQADLPLIQNGNVLSVAAGGTLANNTYTWYKDGAVVATKTGDSTYTPPDNGTYSVSISNPNVPTLTLYSIQTLNTQDSLALIDLYNSTAGNNWVINTNWATTTPAANWAGVVARFGRVKDLYLTTNNLSGPIPASLGNLAGAKEIDLTLNKLSGSIPSSLGDLDSLLDLLLTSNQLTGNIPPSLGNFPNLLTLQIGGNKLTGNIPSSLGNLTGAIDIDLSYDQLSDTIPSSIGNCTNLTNLEINNNQFTGHIPASVERLKNLNVLDVSSNLLTGSIPDSVCYMPNLRYLYVNDNALTGSLPDSLANDSQITQIKAQNNNLSGKINTNLSQLSISFLYLYGNKYNFSAFPITLSTTPPAGWYQVYPQQNVPLTRLQSTLSVSAGGNAPHSTFTLFKDGASISTQTGDSAFAIQGLGNYNIVTTNTDVPGLTLYSDTLRLGLVLPDSSVSTTQTITGSGTTDINTAIFRLAALTPGSGGNALSGDVTTIETIDPTVQSYNGAPYVQRHYDITPAADPMTAQATVTLYFTQADFDSYNAYVTANQLSIPLLPTGGVDNGNLVITQYHGSFTGTASPGNYSQGSQVITPTVAWDATDNWWVVSFPVTGFSGFFLGTGSVPLPLTLLQFTGVPKASSVDLQWSTTDEKNTRQFLVQRSADGQVFGQIGSLPANNIAGRNSYAFTDLSPLTGANFYRLKMQDLDGQFTYSPIIQVSMAPVPGYFSVYPNPAGTNTSLLFQSGRSSHYTIRITDLTGTIIAGKDGTSTIGLNKIDLSLPAIAPGTYLLTLTDEEHGRRTLVLLRE